MVVALAGVAVGVLFAANWHIMYTPIPWLNPPTLAQVVLCYAPAVWSFGSIFSALLLLIARLIGGLGKMAVLIFRRLAGPGTTEPANAGRRLFLKAGVGSLAASPFLLSGYGAAYAARNHMAVELTLPFGCPCAWSSSPTSMPVFS